MAQVLFLRSGKGLPSAQALSGYKGKCVGNRSKYDRPPIYPKPFTKGDNTM